MNEWACLGDTSPVSFEKAAMSTSTKPSIFEILRDLTPSEANRSNLGYAITPIPLEKLAKTRDTERGFTLRFSTTTSFVEREGRCDIAPSPLNNWRN